MTSRFPILACLMLTSLSAWALDKDFVDPMKQTAQSVERDARMVSMALKDKRIDANDVQQKVNTMNTDIAKLQALVAQFESTHPQLSERDQADWKLVRDKVKLLEVFHAQKETLLAGDWEKNRRMIRAHADGIALRAKMLQESVTRIERKPLS